MQYLNNVLLNSTPPTGPYSVAAQAINSVTPLIKKWGGNNIAYLGLSGSYAKGTAVKGGTDIDLFISLSYRLNMGLKEIYDNLHQYMRANGYPYAKAQNVSIGINVNGVSIDLVPARQQSSYDNDHSLYSRKNGTWIKTNIQKHIDVVTKSGRQSEIRLMKLWRNQRKIDFPSFYLELSVIEALKGQPLLGYSNNLENNIVKTLTYLKNNLKSGRIVDPANTNNIISNTLTIYEKNYISQAAAASLSGSWGEFIS